MYAPYFGLSREPFSLAPDPRFLFMSERHREALAHLLYGVGGGGGFVLLTGEIGAGKTTVARGFLEQLPPHCAVAYIFNPQLSVIELLQTVCSEFGIPALPSVASVKAHIDALNTFLLDGHARGRQALLVIDEAQALDPPVLEQLRLLTNLETAERKLLQIVLIGQPELRQMLAQPGLEQLAQRVVARYHLGSLDAAETRQYVAHRLAVAGLKQASPFDAGALAELHRASAGVPRRINLLADRAMLGAYGQHRLAIDRQMVRHAAQEVLGQEAAPSSLWVAGAWAAGLLLAAALAVAVVLWPRGEVPGAPVAAASAEQAAPASAQASSTSSAAVAAELGASSSTASTTLPVVSTQATQHDSAAVLWAEAMSDEGQAWRELALRWQVAIGAGDPCEAAQRAQLACVRHAGAGLKMLQQLARPALLILRDEAGVAKDAGRMAVLVALDDRHAVLQVGARRFSLPLAELVRVWRGELATLVRTPPGWRSGVDADAAARRWVQDALDLALPSAAALPWAQRVTAFQVLQGLPADGQVGPLTLMQLNRSAGVDEPRLLPSLER